MLRSFLQTLLVVAAFSFAFVTQSQAAIRIVNCATGPFTTIQSAVDAASNGDTIVVETCAVPYNENVVISGFTGLHVVGADATDFGAKRAGVGGPVNPPVAVDGANLGGSCFKIDNSEDIKIQNFQLVQCVTAAVEVQLSNRVLIIANRIVGGAVGISSLVTTDFQIISNLVFGTSGHSITLGLGSFSTIADNMIINSADFGITMVGEANSRIDNNVVRGSSNSGLLIDGLNIRVERNSVTGSGSGVDITVSANSFDVDIVGNQTQANIVDNGVGTELANNF